MNESYLSVLPSELCAGIRSLSALEYAGLQEIRLRCGQMASYLSLGREQVIPCGARGYYVDAACLSGIVNRATGYSRYASAEQLRQGFLTLPGGHRLGLCGQAVYEGSGIRTLRELSSVNLRIARACRGAGKHVCSYVKSNLQSTLIAGPPGCGKTTLLRELIRTLSDESGQRVSVVDERFELAACNDGLPGFDVGQMTDVLSGARKSEGVYLLLRTMNPDWIAVDEITDERDVDALLRSSFCGVRILASAHIFSPEDLSARPLYARMCAQGLFRNLILMDKQHNVKLGRMDTNDKACGCSADRDFRRFRGFSDGPERADGGADAGTAQTGAGTDALRDPGQLNACRAAV